MGNSVSLEARLLLGLGSDSVHFSTPIFGQLSSEKPENRSKTSSIAKPGFVFPFVNKCVRIQF